MSKLNKLYKYLAQRNNSPRCFNICLRWVRVSLVLMYNGLFRRYLLSRTHLSFNGSKLSPNPRLSIIVPTFNQEKYLEECLNSILEQTYAPLEIIIVDDGSNTKTKSLLNQYARNSLVTILTHETNLGLPSALNTGIRASNGELVTWVSSDNYISKDFSKNLVDAIVDSPNFLVVYSDFEIVDEKSREIGRDIGWRNYDRIAKKPNRLIMHSFKQMRKFHPINSVGACFIMRREVYFLVGGYTGPQGIEDHMFWMEANKNGPFKKLEQKECLYFYRIHNQSLTSSSHDRDYRTLLINTEKKGI